jgi:hypothetical protein
VLPHNPPDLGTASWVYPNGIGGTVTDTDGSPIAGIDVNLTGTDSTTGKPVSMQAVSASDGSYSFELDPGQYSVTPGPDPAGGRFLVTDCSGTSADQACKVSLETGQFDTADFRRAALIVNSTQLGTDQTEVNQGICDITPTGSTQTCTLPQAILVSNHLGGQPIAFDIPTSGNAFDGSTPQVRDEKGTGIPEVTAPAIIDGTSQPGGEVELSGTAANNEVNGPAPTVGLKLSAASTVKGLVINGYSDGIDAVAGGSTIQGDFFGTNVKGDAAEQNPLGTNTGNQLGALIGVSLASSGNQAGGPGAGQGNVFASHWTVPNQLRPAASLVDTKGGNVIQGNTFGLVRGTLTPLVDPKPTSQYVSELAFSVAGASTIGGAGPGDGNVVAPESSVSGDTSGNPVVQGNEFHAELVAGAGVQVGGTTAKPGTGLGNTFYPDLYGTASLTELTMSGNGGKAEGDLFEPNSDPAIEIVGDHVTIGGASSTEGNLIESTANDPDRSAVDAGIVILGNDNVVENNVLTKNGGWGAVEVSEGGGNTITRNVMTANAQGIEFGNLGYLYDTNRNPSGPNDLELYPVLTSTTSTSSGTTVSGQIDQPGSVTIDLYSQQACGLQNEAPGQGEQFLGSKTVSSTLGDEPFSFTAAKLPAGQIAITATATVSNGSTSEFSPCMLTDSHANQLLGYGVRAPSSTVPITVTAAAAGTRLPSAASGRGTLWLLCPGLTPGACAGTAVIKSTGSEPTPITNQSFTIKPGLGVEVTIQLTGALLSQLETGHKLTVNLTTTAHDGAKPPHSQTYSQQLTLTYG